ncbi:MAG: DUF6339 family protein [Solirubrobacterales bacterium]|nr:DUF6339 family protein [Solirubrobacterales bacterium]
MSGGYLFPKLDRDRARARLEEIRALCPDGPLTQTQLVDEIQMFLPDYTFESIGGQTITEPELLKLREAAVAVATTCGFPNDHSLDARNAFDRRIGKLLHEEMGISPHQAADEDIWAHLTLGVLLDLAAWRFPDLPEARMLGRAPRSTFRRLWWRAEILGAQSWDDEDPLFEDETVQIMERTELAGVPYFARAVASAFKRTVAVNPTAKRMDLMRDALKRTYRLTPFVRLETLSPAELDEQLRDLFTESVRQLSGGAEVTDPLPLTGVSSKRSSYSLSFSPPRPSPSSAGKSEGQTGTVATASPPAADTPTHTKNGPA